MIAQIPDFHNLYPSLLKDMDTNRLTKKILLYDQNLFNCNANLPTWCCKIKKKSGNNLLFSIGRTHSKLFLQMFHESLLKTYIIMFRQEFLNLPKLQNYNTFVFPFHWPYVNSKLWQTFFLTEKTCTD